MKPIEITIPVQKENFRKLADPLGKGHERCYAYVRVADLPDNLPLEVNPRSQNTNSRVSKQIASGLIDSPDLFYLLNRGITLVAKNVDFNQNKLKINFGSGENYGAIDGGHTFRVLQESKEAYRETEEKPEFLDTFVLFEILTNVKPNYLVDIARARNTSAQVQDESLANLQGSFDWLKEALKNQPFAAKIAYRENEDTDIKPIDIREIIGLITMYHEIFEESENPPVMGYASKARCLDMFINPDYQSGYLKLSKMIPDILRLYDYIHYRFAALYEEVGGYSGLNDKHNTSVKLGKVLEVQELKNGFMLEYLSQIAYFRFPDGWLYPVVAALRGLVSYKGSNAKWKADPFKYFDKYGKKFVSMTLEASRALGRRPNSVGKAKGHWIQLHDKTLNNYARLVGADLEKEVVLV